MVIFAVATLGLISLTAVEKPVLARSVVRISLALVTGTSPVEARTLVAAARRTLTRGRLTPVN